MGIVLHTHNPSALDTEARGSDPMFKTSLGSTVDLKLAALQGLGKRFCEVSPTILACQLVLLFFRSCLGDRVVKILWLELNKRLCIQMRKCKYHLCSYVITV